MGVPGLWKLVEGASETWSLRTLALREGFEGLRAERLYYVGIDSSIWMQSMLHQFSAGHAQSGENPELYHLFSRLAMLAERPIHAVFVADGPHRPAYKRGKQVKLPPVWLTDGFRRLVEAFGFAWLEAAGEAEAELAKMSSLGLIDAVMTDDSDTLIFGAAVIIRNPSFKRAGSDKVTVYRRSKVLDKTGFSEDDLLLFALLVGCDYDEGGLRNCGAQIAAGLVRYGLGRVLRRALDTYDDDQLSIYLQGWRDQVRVRLRDDPGKHIGRKSPRLAANVPATFPKVEAARLFATPALLPPSAYEAVLQPRAMDFGRLGTACETFFGWGSTAELVQTFRSALWPDEVVRMLVREGLSHEGITSRVGRAHPLLDLSVESVGSHQPLGMPCVA
ncbi:PIN domain-like protein [Cerioporus squamosus]|nr:PIN domain-like protein [Cerioporus squamosus]